MFSMLDFNSDFEDQLVLDQFDRLNTHPKRVDFVTGLMKTVKMQLGPGLFLQLIKPPKSEAVSEQHRQIGNRLFKLRRDQEAFVQYSTSIAHATGRGECLSLAYANRSAVLFGNGFYKECLIDIQHAFDAGYPKRLRAKLNQRKHQAQAEQNKDKQAAFSYYQPLPELSFPPNPYIESAADCVEIQTNGTYGRHVVATKDIPVGSVIAVEKPFAKSLSAECTVTHCYHCLYASYNLIPCDQCPAILFCSEECKRDSWETYHKYECPILTTLFASGMPPMRLALRTALRLANKTRTEADPTDGVYKSSRYAEVRKLVTMEGAEVLLMESMKASVIFELVEKHTRYFTDFPGREVRDMFKELLLHHLIVAYHDLNNLALDKSTNMWQSTATGMGIYCLGSIFCHSCAPNSTTRCYGDTLVTYTTRPIGKGQQVFQSYWLDYSWCPKESRQKLLKAKLKFDCRCEACAGNWQPVDAQPDHDKRLNCIRGRPAVAAYVLPDMVQKAKRFESRRPCAEFTDVQRTMHACLDSLANRIIALG